MRNGRRNTGSRMLRQMEKQEEEEEGGHEQVKDYY